MNILHLTDLHFTYEQTAEQAQEKWERIACDIAAGCKNKIIDIVAGSVAKRLNHSRGAMLPFLFGIKMVRNPKPVDFSPFLRTRTRTLWFCGFSMLFLTQTDVFRSSHSGF